jgi:hypothetical protein
MRTKIVKAVVTATAISALMSQSAFSPIRILAITGPVSQMNSRRLLTVEQYMMEVVMKRARWLGMI